MGHFPPKFSESPSYETTGRIEKSRGVQKWCIHPLSSCKVWWRYVATRRREKQKLGVFVFTRRATAGISFTQQAILKFFAPQGLDDSRISVKFGTAEGTCGPLRCAKFHANPWIFGVSGPKNAKNCQKFPTFSPPGANPLPDVDEICRVYADNRSTRAVNIWCDSVSKLGIYRQKPQWGIPPPQKKNRSPLVPKLLVGLKKSRVRCKMVRTSSIFMQSLVEIRRCTAVWETKVGCFCFVCLFVCLSRSESRTDSNIQMAILSPFVGQFWYGFQHSVEEEMLFQTCKRYLKIRWRHICLRIKSKFEFFSENSKGKVCAHDLDHLGEG